MNSQQRTISAPGQAPALQRGLGFWGWMLMVGLIGLFLMMLFSLLPHYMDFRTVSAVMTQMENDPEVIYRSKKELMDEFRRRCRLNNLSDFDFKERIRVEAAPREAVLWIDYEVRVPTIVDNLFLVLDFEQSATFTRGGG